MIKVNNQDIEYALLSAAGLIVLIVVVAYLFFRRSLKSYDQRWKELQKLLADRKTWEEAIVKADALLDDMLKRRRFKGKTMGERLVAAQHEIQANDAVWFSHKYKNKLELGQVKLKKSDVKKCLLGFWQALMDLGAFKPDEEEE